MNTVELISVLSLSILSVPAKKTQQPITEIIILRKTTLLIAL